MVSLHDPDPTRWEFWKAFLEESQRGPAWREAGSWALGVLEEQLGDRWLHLTWTKYALPGPLVLSPAHTIAFAELLELALRLDLLRDHPGMGVVRRNLRRDPREQQLAHLRIQLEVGGLALRAGYDIRFEERLQRSGRPVDIALSLGGRSFNVEIAAILPDERSQEAHRYTDMLFGRIREIEFRHRVTCEGEFKERLGDDDTDALLGEIEAAAQLVKEGAGEKRIEAFGAVVIVSGQETSVGSGLRGPKVESQLWPRTEGILRRKAEQSASSQPTWLRIDSLDGLWQFTPWAYTPLAQKLEALTEPVRASLAECHHVTGVVMTSGAAFAQGVFREESSQGRSCFARRRLLEPLRVRESMIIGIQEKTVRSSEAWLALYDEEASWFDWALERVALPSSAQIFGD